MTAVLLQSNRVGLTGWICLRRGNCLQVSGIEAGDSLMAFFKPQGEELSIDEDGYFFFPPEAEHVLVEHQELGQRESGGGVNVDLIRKKV